MLAKWQHQSLVSCQRWSVGSRLVHVEMKATSPHALSVRTVRLTRARRRGTATRYPVILSNQPAPCGSNQCHVRPPRWLCQFVTCVRPLVLLCAKCLAQNQTYLASLSGHWTSRPLAFNGHFDVALWLGWHRWVFAGCLRGAIHSYVGIWDNDQLNNSPLIWGFLHWKRYPDSGRNVGMGYFPSVSLANSFYVSFWTPQRVYKD